MQPKKTILIAEDDKFLSNIYRLKFTEKDFNVISASDGDEALIQLQKIKPDIIILDLLMPKKGGFQVLAELKNNPLWKNIPVIIATNLGQPEDMKRAMELGAADYFIKADTKIDDVVSVILKHLP